MLIVMRSNTVKHCWKYRIQVYWREKITRSCAEKTADLASIVEVDVRLRLSGKCRAALRSHRGAIRLLKWDTTPNHSAYEAIYNLLCRVIHRYYQLHSLLLKLCMT